MRSPLSPTPERSSRGVHFQRQTLILHATPISWKGHEWNVHRFIHVASSDFGGVRTELVSQIQNSIFTTIGKKVF